MPAMPAYCRNCKTSVNSGIVIENATNANFRNNRVRCNRCGGWAVILDGTVDVAQDVIKIVRAGPNTMELLRAFADLAQRAAEQDRPFTEFVEQAEKIAPAFGDLARKVGSQVGEGKPSRKWWIAFAAAVGMVLNSCDVNVNVAIDVNDIVKQVIQHMETTQVGK